MEDQAEIHRMAWSEDVEERQEAANQLYHDFTTFPDKNQGWDDLHRLTMDEKSCVRVSAASALGVAFSYVSDKNQVWGDLHRLTQDKDNFVRGGAASALGAAFSHVPDKNQAWDDLHQLTQDENSGTRESAAEALGVAFSLVPERKQAWNDLHNLTQDEDSGVREEAGYTLVAVFSDLPDKNQAWDDLRRLTKDDDSDVIDSVVYAIGPAFLQMLDKNQAWDDMHHLAMDEDSGARVSVAVALGAVFPNMPDKNRAWDDLHRLTQDKDIFVRWHVTEAIGAAYPHIPDEHKQEACDDLIWLTRDKEGHVRALAYFSLGKVSIFRAEGAEKEDVFKKDMEEAIQYFEKASQETSFFNPAKFCLPFYRSFYTLTFKKEEAEAEVNKYLAEAKNAVEGSESKEKLLEAVENLGNALKEGQNLRDFDASKSDLNAYRRYCDRACELLKTTENKAPGASRLIRKGLPIIDEKNKGITEEIQDKAKALCKKTRGTSLEEMGFETVKQANELSSSNELKKDKSLEQMNGILNKFCEYVPEEKRAQILEDLKKAKYLDSQGMFETTLNKLNEIYKNFKIPPIITVPANKENKQKQDIVRIAAIQFGFQLTNSFPPSLEKKDECKQKIISALDTAKSCGTNIACLPELCMCEGWVQDIRDRYPDMIIIGGSYYKNDFNECPVIMNLEVPPQLKKSPSRPEDPEITGRGMKSGDKLFRYETHLGTFSVLLCIDFLNYARFCDQTDIIFCPSYTETKGIERFHEYANAHVTNIPSYIIISNTALFGGTSIFGQLHRDYYGRLVESGCKRDGDNSSKLCDLEKGFEGIILADFDLVHKSPQVQTPMDSNKVIKSIKNIRKMKIS